MNDNKTTIWQILLGTFIILEVVMMLAENCFAVIERGWPQSLHGELIWKLRSLPRNYTRLTGQLQNWSMFAPPPEHSISPVVELYEQDSSRPYARLMDPIRPADPDAYFHPYGPGDRLCRYQAEMMLILLAFETPGIKEQHAQECQEFAASKVREQWKMIRAYLQWRLAQAEQEGGQAPLEQPAAMILAAEIAAIPRPGEPWQRPVPYRRPYARWERSLEGSLEWLPILAYDPIEQRFRRLPVDENKPWE